MADLTLFGYPVNLRTVAIVDTDRGPLIVPVRTTVPPQLYVGTSEINLSTTVHIVPPLVLSAISDAEKHWNAKPRPAPKPKTPNEVAADHLESAAKALREAG